MRSWVWLGTVPLVFAACSGGSGFDPGTTTGSDFVLGSPIENLPAPELASFNRGKVLFEKRFTPSEGLGPYYNSASCAACHEVPVIGGSAVSYRNFILGAVGFPGSQVALPNVPPLPSQVVPSFYGFTGRRPDIPATISGLPVTAATRNAPPLFGTGLFEFVTNATILANADPDDANADGISGRFNRDAPLNIGRFGYKCQANNIESFIRGAIQNQMGITTNPVAGCSAAVSLVEGPVPQVGAGCASPTTDTDGIPDPEFSVQEMGDVINFCRFIAPPRRRAMTPQATNGEAVFAQIGCTGCHIPVIQSAFGPLEAYSDLLIHNMGPGLADGISQGNPQPSILTGPTTDSEFRTQPLWGVGFTAPFFHNGSADTLTDAILMHGGEAQTARDAFSNLPQASQDDVIAFLEIL